MYGINSQFWFRGLMLQVMMILGLSLTTLQSVHSQEPRKLAIVIGVDVYRTTSGLPPLNYAVDDAQHVSKTLRGQGYEVVEMTHTVAQQPGAFTMAPNADYIRDQLKLVLGHPNLGARDSVILSFHGHGVQYSKLAKAKTGQEIKTPKFYFCPADCTLDGLETANQIEDQHHLIALDELYASLEKCKASTRLLIVDACRNDPTAPTLFRSTAASATLPRLPSPPAGIAAFFSCKANERAIEDPRLAHGVFTQFLIEGLGGKADQVGENGQSDGIVTLSELSAYVSNNTYSHVHKNFKLAHRPELKGDFNLTLPLAKHRVKPSSESANLHLLGDNSNSPDNHVINSIGMRLALIKAGVFMMGASYSENRNYVGADEVPYRCEMTKDYYIGTTEVTQGQWESIMGKSPRVVPHGRHYPVTTVSWRDVEEFCRRLSAKEGRNYRLPTEAEWEYACRGGTDTAYYFGKNSSDLGDYAWFKGNRGTEGHSLIAKKNANPFGLYDMLGNVKEWCSDRYGPYTEAPRPVYSLETLFSPSSPNTEANNLFTDPTGPQEGVQRVIRGGSWYDDAGDCRSACRECMDENKADDLVGFRVALDQ